MFAWIQGFVWAPEYMFMPLRLLFPCVILLLWLLAALGASILPLQANKVMLDNILSLPSATSPLGYDDLGRPIVDRLIAGARTSLLVAFSVVSITLITGVAIGMAAAWLGGWCDRVLVFVIDVFMAFPGVLLAIAFSSLMGPGVTNVVIALSIVGWVGFARLTRAQVLSVKERDHVLASRALGLGGFSLVCRHVLPLIVAPLIIETTFAVAATVIAEAGLSFLGLGVQPPAPSWGSMIRDGARFMLVAPHMVLAPAVVIFLVVLSINLCGDLLRDRLDVKAGV